MYSEDIKDKKIILGISGGVDSSVAAHLLLEAGCDVTGVFMQNWEEVNDGICTAQLDYEDAKSVCLKLNIPFYAVNFAKEYWDRVFTYFLEEYKKGRTPNPDVLCNSEIKFKAFLDYSVNTFGADIIATGHYARKITDENGKAHLMKAYDANKDQSYFLCFLSQYQLSKAIFPLGEIDKSLVRDIAKKLSLRTAEKKDSTGICFIGERNFTKFLSEYLPAQPGDIVDKDSENIIGRHNGLMYYTIGQRKGLGIGNLGAGERWFVCDKNLENNILYVAQGANNPHLFKRGFTSCDIHLIDDENKPPENACVKYRYRQEEKKARILFEGERVTVIFDEKQSGITPGQIGAFYYEDECFGGCVIDDIIEN